jgi:hypothetical protein
MGYFDELIEPVKPRTSGPFSDYESPAQASFAQHFGDGDGVAQPPTDALGRWRVVDAEGRLMSDIYKKLARPSSEVITEDTLAMKEAEQARKAAAERVRAGVRRAGTPASLAQHFGEWEGLPQQPTDALGRWRVVDAEGRPMSDLYPTLARPWPVRERKADWDIDGTDVVKSGVTGVAKGVIGLAGGGGDTWSLIDSGLTKAGLSEGQRNVVRNVLAATPFG